MAPLSLTCFLLILLFTTSSFSNITTHAHHQDGDAVVKVDDVPKGKRVLAGELTSTVGKDQRLGGRRMSSVVKVKKAKKVKESGISGQTTSQVASGEVEDQRKKMSNAARKNKVSHQFSTEMDQKEFVAFNADYRAPRHHPPKNN